MIRKCINRNHGLIAHIMSSLIGSFRAEFLALLAYLSFLRWPFYYLLRRGATFSVGEKSVLAGLLAGYFFQNIFVFDNMTSYLLFFSVLCYIAWRNGGRLDSQQLSRPRPKTNKKTLPLPLSEFLFPLYLSPWLR